MTIPSIAQEEIPIQDGVRTAVIYNVPEIAEYIVEINDAHEHFFIEKNGENVRYGNLSDAIAAARRNHVIQCYLALSKTYQETESAASTSNAHPANKKRFDYLPLQLSSCNQSI
jgi:hypothetical protein